MTPQIQKLQERRAKIAQAIHTVTDQEQRAEMDRRHTHLVRAIHLATQSLLKKCGALALLLVILVSCHKSNDAAAGYTDPNANKTYVRFYSTNGAVTVEEIIIKVNGITVGQLKYSKTTPDCSAADFPAIYLKPGSYTADYVDIGSPNGLATRQVSFTVPTMAAGCIFFDLK